MRKFNLCLLLFSALLLSACCTKKDCKEFIEITLNNFTAQEVDSVLVRSYQKNTNFTVLIDSSFEMASGANDNPPDLRIFFRNGFNYNLEYRIDAIRIGKTYLITGFSMERKECNSCFPWGHDYWSALDKYYVNGAEQHSDRNGIIINK